MRKEHWMLARNSLLLSSTPEPVAQKVLETAHERVFDRGATIFLQGERAKAIYIVAEGWVKLYRIAPAAPRRWWACSPTAPALARRWRFATTPIPSPPRRSPIAA